MQAFILGLIVSCCHGVAHGALYKPGEPGSEWSMEEMLAVKFELQRIMTQDTTYLEAVGPGPVSALGGRNFTGAQILARFDGDCKKKDGVCTGDGIDEGKHLHDAVRPDVAKVVRLAFHDCIADSETGGCNGCLNFHGMGVEGVGVESDGCQVDGTCAKDALGKTTDNNNLLWVARVLEDLYDNEDLKIPNFSSDFPKEIRKMKKMKISGSLRQNGKSRADLWAFAGLVAVELGTLWHNTACDGDNMKNYCGGQPDEYANCKVELPEMVFKYGRKDCAQPCTGVDAFYGFCSPASEAHPDPQGNGKSVTDFFKDEFGLTGRETVALMGAHTLGHTNEQISGLRHYPWVTSFGKKVLNNDYYKFIVSPNFWKRDRTQIINRFTNVCENGDASTFIGDEHGNPWHVDWVVRSQWQNNDGGPWNWNPFARLCDSKICESIEGDLHPRSCCKFFDGQICTFETIPCGFGWCERPDKYDCTMPTFLAASMMNVDMGLYLNFTVEEGDTNGMGHGRPQGCPGLNRPDWLKNTKRDGPDLNTFDAETYLQHGSKGTASNKHVAHSKYSDIVQGNRYSGCGLNRDVTESGEEMHEIMEQFAADNQLFITEFAQVFTKMIENGYSAGGKNDPLKSNNWNWLQMRCTKKTCYPN